jgi:hypothetical protein
MKLFDGRGGFVSAASPSVLSAAQAYADGGGQALHVWVCQG